MLQTHSSALAADSDRRGWSSAASLVPPALADGTVLHLLFDLTQQSARFESVPDAWNQLAVYDTDGFAAFTGTGEDRARPLVS